MTPPETKSAQWLRDTMQRFSAGGRRIKYNNNNYAIIIDEDIDKVAGIGCFVCGMISWDVNDVAAKYCGNCHVYHETG